MTIEESELEDILLDDAFEVVIVSLFNKLYKNQEPLGSEFQKVLDDNHWNLITNNK